MTTKLSDAASVVIADDPIETGPLSEKVRREVLSWFEVHAQDFGLPSQASTLSVPEFEIDFDPPASWPPDVEIETKHDQEETD